MSNKRIPSKEKTVRKTVPQSLISITDRYKTEIRKELKPKFQDSLTDKVVLEIILRGINNLPPKEILKVSLSKIPKKYRK